MKRRTLLLLALAGAAPLARADAVDMLRAFVRDVKSGSAAFTQTVTSPDGAKRRVSSGRFAFARPDRFRFEYLQPYEQLIVADGRKVWIWDKDLNQASSRAMSAALGATPAALLAGGSLERDFDLAALPAQAGLDWVEAKPKAADTQFRSIRVAFRGRDLAAVEIVDAFGQRSALQFDQWQPNAAVAPEAFRFEPPAGAEVLEQ